jgi:hypothetical protein
VNPVRVTPDFMGDNDNLLEPGEMWRYVATGVVLDLAAEPLGDPIVTGCNNVPVGSGPRNTYENTGTVMVPGDMDSDPSHYCNEPICGDGIVGNTPGETCDPPGQPAGQPNECRGDCTFCGDGVLDAVEECDDGNTAHRATGKTIRKIGRSIRSWSTVFYIQRMTRSSLWVRTVAVRKATNA